MNRKYLIPLIIGLLCALLLAGNALAMRSTNYRLDWYTPLTGSGGGPASSAHYAANVTIGQAAIGSCASTHYAAGLGYWYGITEYRIYLPLVMRNSV